MSRSQVIVIPPTFSRTAERVRRIDWGKSAGLPLPPAIAGFCTPVESPRHALALLRDDEWETWSLELQSALMMHLNKIHHPLRHSWNLFAAQAKQMLMACEPAIVAALDRSGLTSNVALDAVCWDVVGALVCSAYLDRKPPTDMLRLLDVYEAGHFPVGWNAEKQCVLVY